jgi:abortive infection bacteriophage resistance protein
MLVANDDEALSCLRRNGYYRLSAYWYPFREFQAGVRSDQFLPGTQFEEVLRLYSFDKDLKLLLLDAIERVELATRVEIALQLGEQHTFAHLQPALFHPDFTNIGSDGSSKYDKWIERFNARVNDSRDEFTLHHRRQYGQNSPLPIWIAIELWDFGITSYAYSGLRIRDQVRIAQRFGIAAPAIFKSWLRTLNYVRNVIAHHGRLWNQNLTVVPKLPRLGQMPDFDALASIPNVSTRVYSVCCILSHITQVVNPNSTWIADFSSLIKSFPTIPHIRIGDMGIPIDWESHGFWR